MSQIIGGEDFTNVSPGNRVTDARLDNHVNGAVLLNGAILDQVAKTITVEADMVLLGDSTLPASGIPKKVTLTNLLPEAIRQGVPQFGTDGAVTDAYVVTLSPLPTTLTAGMVVRFKAATANTGNATLSLVTSGSPTTAKNILTPAKRVLQTGDILADQLCECVYDGTQFILTSARSLRLGIEEFGTGGGSANAQTVTLSPTATVLTAGMRVRFVAAATNTSAVTLTVDSLSATSLKKVVAGAAASLVANDIQTGDVVTAEYDGTQFMLTSRVRSWDYVSTSAGTLANGLLTFTHGLGATPSNVRTVFINTTAHSVWAIGDEIDAGNVQLDTGGMGCSFWANATGVYFCINSTGSLFASAGSGSRVALTAGNWKVKVYASL